MSSTVTGFKRVHTQAQKRAFADKQFSTHTHTHTHTYTQAQKHTHTHTHSLDIILTLECGRGMQGGISVGDQILAMIKRPVCLFV